MPQQSWGRRSQLRVIPLSKRRHEPLLWFDVHLAVLATHLRPPVNLRPSPTPDRVAIAVQSMNIIPRLRLAEL